MISRVVVFLMVAALGFAACGGDTEDESGAEDFRAEADSICRSGVEQLLKMEPLPADAPSETIVADLEKGIEIRSQVLEDLEALEPPSDLAGEFDDVLAARENSLAVLEREIELAKDGVAPDEPPYQKVLTDYDEAAENSEEAAAEVGLTDCAAKLSPEVEEEVKRVVETFEIEPLDDCTEYATDELIKIIFGSLEQCQKDQNNPPPEGFTKSMTFEDVGGQEELSAYAIATMEGGPNDGQRLQFSLVYEDDTYKVDGVFLAAE